MGKGTSSNLILKLRMKLRSYRSLLILLPLIPYFAGAFFIKGNDLSYLSKIGVASQEEYTYYDNDGEESETLITLEGLGKVLTYSDVYIASVPMIVVFLTIGRIVFGDKDGRLQLETVIFGNCVLGVLLIYVTSKENILPTILFWVGIIIATITREIRT